MPGKKTYLLGLEEGLLEGVAGCIDGETGRNGRRGLGFANQLEADFMVEAITLPAIQFRIGQDKVLPSVLTSLGSGDDVIDIKLLSGQFATGILADPAITLKDGPSAQSGRFTGHLGELGCNYRDGCPNGSTGYRNANVAWSDGKLDPLGPWQGIGPDQLSISIQLDIQRQGIGNARLVLTEADNGITDGSPPDPLPIAIELEDDLFVQN